MKRFLKRNGKAILKAALILALAIVAYILAHKAGTAERGYEAVGGEMFIPFLIIFAEDIWKVIKDMWKTINAPFKAVKENEH